MCVCAHVYADMCVCACIVCVCMTAAGTTLKLKYGSSYCWGMEASGACAGGGAAACTTAAGVCVFAHARVHVSERVRGYACALVRVFVP